MFSTFVRHIFMCLSGLIILVFALPSYAQHKGINFQAVIKSPGGVYPSIVGTTVTLQILDPVNECVLREEVHSGVNITNGYVNLVIGSAAATTPAGRNPAVILSLNEVLNNSVARNGLNCVDATNTIVLTNQTYTPSSNHARKLRLRTNIGADIVVADFNMRSVAFAVNAEMLNGKTEADFINTTTDVTQARTNALFAPAVYDNLLNLSSSSTGALLIPAGTTGQRPGVASMGMIRFNDTTNQVEFHDGASWTSLATGTTAGETNTASNQGAAGVGVFKQKTGVDLEFKNINAGSNKISVTNDAANNEIDVDVNVANLGVVENLGFTPSIKAVGNAAFPAEVATGSGRIVIVTDTQKVYRDGAPGTWNLIATVDYADLANKPTIDTLVPSQATHNGKYLTTNGTNVSWSTLPASGETNTASNLTGTAGAVGLFKTKSGVDLQFKKINAGSNKIAITDDTVNDELDIDINQANLAIAWSQLTSVPTTLAGYGITDAISSGTLTTKGDILVRDGTSNTRLPVGTNGFVLSADSAESTGLKWIAIPAAPITSVGINLPSATETNVFSVGADITASGDIDLTLDNQAQNSVFAGPSTGGAGAPTFRSLVAADIPNLPWSKITSGTPTTRAGYGITDAAASGANSDITSLSGLTTALSVGQGGTGATTFGTNNILIGNGTSALNQITTANDSVLLTNGTGVPSWTAKTTDTFTQYALLAGRAGGQTINGGTAASNSLTLDSTSNATKGNILINPTGGNVGVGTTTPDTKLHIVGTNGTTLKIVDGNQAAGRVLTSDANGVASWASAASSESTTVSNVGTGGQIYKDMTPGTQINLRSILGTTNQVVATQNANDITLSLPQNIHTGASPTFTGMTLSGMSSAGFVKNTAAGVLSGGNSVSLTADITGILPVANGGTGVASPTSGNLLVGAGTSAMTLLAPGAAGGYVRSDGTSWVRSTIQTGDLPAASTTASGIVELALSSETTAGLAVQASDTRLLPTPIVGDALKVPRLNAGGTAYELITGANFLTAYLPSQATHAGKFLTTDGAGNISWGAAGAGDMVLASAQTVTGAKSFNANTLLLNGSTSGTTTLNAAAVAGTGTVTLPTSGTLATLDGTETLTNKTLTSPVLTTPTVTTSLTTPLILGGTSTTQTLTYRTTSGVGAAGADHIFQVGNNGATEAMRILNSGNVGIGTSAPFSGWTNSPNRGLHVNGNNSFIGITDSGGGERWGLRTTLNGFSIFNDTDNQYRLFVNNAGNVGIGTDTPDTKLHIVGTNGTTLKVVDGNQAAGRVLTSDANGVASWAALPAGGANPAGSANEVQFRSNGTTFGANSNFVWDNTNARLGIGDPSPNTKLVVNGPAIAGNAREVLSVRDTTSAAAGVGPGISFYGNYNGTDAAMGASIKAAKSNATAGNFSFDLAFLTRLHAAGDVTERMRILSSGEVGIGTSSPQGVLHVQTPTNTDTNQPRFLSGGGNGSWNQIDIGANFSAYESTILRYSSGGGTPGTGSFQIMNRGLGAQLIVHGNGNVGIGSLTPSEKLDVSGKVKGTELCIGADCRNAWPSGGGGSPAGGDTQVQFNSSGAFGSDSNFIWDNTNKRLGIGTTAPASALHIASGVASFYPTPGQATSESAVFSNNQDATIRIRHSGGISTLYTDSATQSINFSTNGHTNSRMYIDGAGKVSIGTTAVTSTLNLRGPSDSHTDSGLSLFRADGSSRSSFFQGGDNNLYLWNHSATGGIRMIGGNDTGQATSVVQLTSDGKLGVGTTSPDTKLHVVGTSGNTLKIVDGNQAAGRFLTSDANGVASWTAPGHLGQFATTTSAQLSGVLSDETGSGAAVFGTSPTIATPTFTTNITTPLILGGTSTTQTLTYRTTSGVGTTGADHIFQVGNNGATEAMRILNNGNVGIGTSNPGYKLTVSGGVHAGYLYTNGTTQVIAGSTGATPVDGFISWTTTGASGGSPVQVAPRLRLGGSAWDTGSVSAKTINGVFELMPVSGNPASGYIRLGVDPGTGTYNYPLAVHSSGNVGIGTTTPSGLLHVNGGSSPQILLSQSSTSTDGFLGGIDISNTNAEGPATVGRFQVLRGNAPLEGRISFETRDGATMAERMRIDENGNVGIGTTSPAAKLDVNGSIVGRATSNGTATIDYLTGNIQYTTADCGTFALHNMKSGSSYTFIVQGTNVATCSFNAFSDAGTTGLTVHMPPDHDATTNGTHTLYSFIVAGSHVYVSWIPGY